MWIAGERGGEEPGASRLPSQMHSRVCSGRRRQVRCQECPSPHLDQPDLLPLCGEVADRLLHDLTAAAHHNHLLGGEGSVGGCQGDKAILVGNVSSECSYHVGEKYHQL